MPYRPLTKPVKIGPITAKSFQEAAYALRQHAIRAADYDAWKFSRSIRDSQVPLDRYLENRIREWPAVDKVGTKKR